MFSKSKTKRNGILLIGPISPPLGGEALAFKVVVDYLIEEKQQIYLIDKARFKDSKLFPIFNPISFIIDLIRFSRKSIMIYATSGTNLFGKFRDIIMAFFAKLFGIKVMYHMHGNAFLELKDKSFIDFFLKRAINSFDQIIVLSSLFMEKLNYISSLEKVFVVPNSIYPGTPQFIYNSKNDLQNQKNKKFTLLYMSHVLPSKGLFDVLKALEKFDLLGFDFVFHFAGSFIQEGNHTIESIKASVDHYKNKLGDKFHIHGFVDNGIKWQLLKESHVFLLPTQFHSEGLPISILEAMYFGQTIITTRWRAIPEIIEENKNGFFVKYKNHEEIFTLLKFLYNNREIVNEIGYENHIEVRKKYLPNNFKLKIMEQIYSFYHSI